MSTCVCVCYTLYVFILKYIAVYTYWKNFRWYNVYVYKHGRSSKLLTSDFGGNSASVSPAT